MSNSSFSWKGGWHPKGKDGSSKESWRGDFKGINQVAGWMGKGRDPSDAESAKEHVSRPISSLKDPTSFGPPPRHINYHGPAALPNQTTPDTQGLGAPLSQEQIRQEQIRQQEEALAEEEESEKPKPPPVPYRVNTTGLSTDHLPPPPARRVDSPNSSSSGLPSSAKPKPKPPQLPPRLPSRTAPPPSQIPSPPPAYSSDPPSPSKGYLNQEATARLANAGVSVPALGIGDNSESSPAASRNPPVNELQSRFSQLHTNSDSPSAVSATPASPPPVRAPYSGTAELAPLPGFRDRHADKIDMGKQKLGALTSRLNTFVEDQKFSANANKRIPRPPGPNSPASPARASPSNTSI
ncbi:hypothetical protein N7470_003744 [Penicillium chermesinum]|nr:hypothetical protein N7470_003744 [Penicillium chermesinum]